jgi:hypothetical protein
VCQSVVGGALLDVRHVVVGAVAFVVHDARYDIHVQGVHFDHSMNTASE